MSSWRATEENKQCACCTNEEYIPKNFENSNNRIIINISENLCSNCEEYWCTPEGQTLIKERLQIHEGRTCNLCGKKVEEELRGLGPVLHNECIQAINNYMGVIDDWESSRIKLVKLWSEYLDSKEEAYILSIKTIQKLFPQSVKLLLGSPNHMIIL